ncbi:MAG: hypothetical protein ACOYMN_02205 [Roseimicrobium sp.]
MRWLIATGRRLKLQQFDQTAAFQTLTDIARDSPSQSGHGELSWMSGWSFGELLQFENLGPVVQGRDKGGEEFCGVLTEFGFQEFDEVGDVPRDGHVAGHGKFRAGEEGFDLAEEGGVRLRFEQGDEVAEEGDARRGAERSDASSRRESGGLPWLSYF